MKQKMYIGPTVPGLIRENVIFRDELPKAVSDRMEKDKCFKRLIIPMADVMDAEKQMEQEGSVLSVAYETVKKTL